MEALCHLISSLLQLRVNGFKAFVISIVASRFMEFFCHSRSRWVQLVQLFLRTCFSVSWNYLCTNRLTKTSNIFGEQNTGHRAASEASRVVCSKHIWNSAGERSEPQPRAARGSPNKARMRPNCCDSAAAPKLPRSAGKRAQHVRDILY